ncbi:ATP-binding protein [Pseudonocardia hydrocarbonoxydans]|uniref:biotin carboxylase n=1 Tax=Pseudonocardia hydrocarbonoxydans TaxID=76726 RepID=A0A4Y3WIP1_9PSEU|nr:carboxyl transferase domain-containing protein [Pseudonocardia hydrocarbonoxydans]GEC18812.1 fused acetyl/propionyl-CoA carboxylase subuit alpha/methylmalonyl-CoA decarboxylase subunit alpha [Pseudonocardia hydrocarbonoxydans]
MNQAFQRIAIVNRGEPAMRLIHAVREWNAEPDRRPLRTIAFYTAVDRAAMFVREADEAVLIGSPDPDQAFTGTNPYLDLAVLERALRETRAEAVWPGWGFVSERAEFAQLCADLGIVFIGPSAQVMERLGDKIAAKRLAEEVGVPLAAWSGGPVADVDAAREHAEKIGYPLMVKATAGGGGRGIRRVTRPEDLAEAFERAGSEAAKTAGDATVFLERAISGGRHVEVQVVADATGDVWTLGVRDCSVQRRNQKVIEESASTALDAEQEQLLRDSAAALAKAAGYVNAGTVEFLYEPKERLLSFLEVNTRLQVEHPVTEATTGVDIVKLQLHVAMGGRLADIADGAPPARGHAIEARLTAEDPENGFAPAPGRIEHLALPSGPGVRVDTGVAAGDVIPPQYDSMIAKVIAWGRDRDEALARLGRALHQTAAVIDGGTTNKAFLIDLLGRPEIVSGDTDTTWLDGLMAAGYTPPQRLDVALLATAVEAQEAHVARQRERLFASAERGRPEVGHDTWYQVDVRAGGESYRLHVAQSRGTRYRVLLDGTPLDVDTERTGRFERKLTVGGRTFAVLTAPQDPDVLVEVDGAVHRISGGEVGLVRAPAPAMVVSIPVAAGDEVEAGDVVAVVESMKLETALRAPVAGRVAEILVDANTQVEGGTKLVRLQPDADADAATGGARADLSGLTGADAGSTDAAAEAADALTSLRFLVLGFDIDERDARPLLDRLTAARDALPPDDASVLAGETAVLRIFSDLCALSRNRRGSADGEPTGEQERNPQEYLHAYLRSRDADAEGLPESFQARLRQALAHYGVPDLERSDALSAALYRMFLAHRRASAHVPVVLALLQWRLTHPDALPESAREDYLRTLDQLVTATQLRHPVVGSLARRVRYTCFDAPLIAAERAHGQQLVRERLDALPAPGDPARAEGIERIVAAAEPILDVFGEQHHAAMLEVMTRRYYRVRPLRDVTLSDRGGRPLLTATYTHRDQDVTVLATTVYTSPDAPAGTDPMAVQGDLRRLLLGVPAGTKVALDLYVIAGEAPDADPERSAEKILALLGRLPEPLAQVAVAVRRPRGDERSAWFTFRPGPDRRPVEDRTLRGLHPMVAERLGLWRLEDFELTRLPSPVDVHLFRAVGRKVPDDARLVVLSDVRDLTLLRGEDGSIRALPQLEHVLDSCLDALRSARAADRGDAKLEWNRVLLYIWPVVDVPLAELGDVVRLLAPRTDALGLEQVLVQFRLASGRVGEAGAGEPSEHLLRMSRPPGAGLTVRVTEPPTWPMRELDAYAQKVIRARRRGAVYPYELVPMLLRNPDPGGAQGVFTEYDLDDAGHPVVVERAPGGNTANLVLGTVTTPTVRYPEGMTRVVLIGDPTKALGALAEPECRRVLAAIELARRLDAPIEWFAVSAGAKIAMDSGTENMDWISRVLRGIIEFTQDGGELNVVVTGINVGAQPYWNAEATMLMHTKGILVMTPDSAMVLTGKQSLDYSGGVSAEDNFGIGGYDRIMGPNGQAQYWAPDLSGAVDVLLAHYAHTYRAPGERFPRPAQSSDPVERDVSSSPHNGPGCDFATVGEVFSSVTNPERKKPFDIRSVMAAVADADHPTLERWADMIDAEGVVVLDAHLGGQPVALLGIESRPLPRRGRIPVDGPSSFTAGTLFPKSSKKTARAINAASGNRPLVVLANLSGFDGSPESLREVQLEFGAEIGRAVVNFDGPIVFCVVSRYHGGAFVVFSKTLHDNMEVAAVEGSYASVIGGAPAAAVVFAGEVNKRTAADPRVADLQARVTDAQQAGDDAEAARLSAELVGLRPAVRSEKLGQVADEFDTAHSVQRAQRVGSVDRIVPGPELRPYLIGAVRRGMERAGG